jgi:hypothetical protein
MKTPAHRAGVFYFSSDRSFPRKRESSGSALFARIF